MRRKTPNKQTNKQTNKKASSELVLFDEEEIYVFSRVFKLSDRQLLILIDCICFTYSRIFNYLCRWRVPKFTPILAPTSLYRQWWRLYTREILSRGTSNNRRTNNLTNHEKWSWDVHFYSTSTNLINDQEHRQVRRFEFHNFFAIITI